MHWTSSPEIRFSFFGEREMNDLWRFGAVDFENLRLITCVFRIVLFSVFFNGFPCGSCRLQCDL